MEYHSCNTQIFNWKLFWKDATVLLFLFSQILTNRSLSFVQIKIKLNQIWSSTNFEKNWSIHFTNLYRSKWEKCDYRCPWSRKMASSGVVNQLWAGFIIMVHNVKCWEYQLKISSQIRDYLRASVIYTLGLTVNSVPIIIIFLLELPSVMQSWCELTGLKLYKQYIFVGLMERTLEQFEYFSQLGNKCLELSLFPNTSPAIHA